jgi:hypothetical protein
LASRQRQKFQAKNDQILNHQPDYTKAQTFDSQFRQAVQPQTESSQPSVPSSDVPSSTDSFDQVPTQQNAPGFSDEYFVESGSAQKPSHSQFDQPQSQDSQTPAQTPKPNTEPTNPETNQPQPPLTQPSQDSQNPRSDQNSSKRKIQL